VFDPFFTTKAAGTSLGMAIVQRIIEAHQGTVRVEDNPQGEACIVLMLPRTSCIINI
jgi:signal transduction histidine kinase